MKKHFTVIFSFLLIAGIQLSAQKISSSSVKGNEVSVTSVLDQIKNSYDIALKKLKSENKSIEIEEASLTFSLSESKTAGIGLQLWIIKIGRKRTTTKSSSVTFNLSKDEDKGTESVAPLDKLALIIYNSAIEYHKLQKTGVLDLKADDFTVEVSFGVTKSSEGGAEIKIFSAEGSKEKTYEHSFTLKFKKPKG
jgi:hypothetical protein